MYISRIELRESPEVSKLHGAVERAFEGERARRLWRLDETDTGLNLYIVSRERPSLEGVSEQFGKSEPRGVTKNYEPLLERLGEGQRWHFRLCANPTKSEMGSGGAKRGKVTAIRCRDEQCKWLVSRAEKCGFYPNQFFLSGEQWQRFSKSSGHFVEIYSIIYEGVLTVTDAEAFRAALTGGIGRGKAYGCGLLTIAREQS
jgi:CRISPR system Cascade subunit CasE